MLESIAVHLSVATQKLTAVTDVPQLEAEILLAHLLQKSRSYLLACADEIISSEIVALFWQLVARRLQGEPIAYLVGHKEFWSLDLCVTKDVLIPRPETELLVELVLDRNNNTEIKVLDLGTGSGVIALSIAHERPEWKVTATDKSIAALKVAQENAERLNIKNINFLHGSWFEAFVNHSAKFNIIISNPPYIAESDEHLKQGDLRFEPLTALASGKQGLDAIAEIILCAGNYLYKDGYLFLEHGYQQGHAVRLLLAEAGYVAIETQRDFAGLERVSFGQIPH